MQIRLLTWLFLCVSMVVVPLLAQTQPQGTLNKPGTVLIAKTTGTVNMIVNGVSTPVKVNDVVPQAAKIVTQLNSSVVLVFSNGATTQLGPDTDLVVEEFLQDDFPSTIKVADLTDEPSVSRTKLMLNKGEIVGNVKKLKHANGSSFTVQTPVGAAGIRGTTFRIVFRPGGTGQAFGAQGAQNFQFQLSTLEGDVGFQQGAAGGPAQGGTTTVPGVSVPTGQEIVVTVTMTPNAQGELVLVSSPTVNSTAAISPAAAAAFAATAQEIIASSANATFTPQALNPSGSPGGNSGTGGGPGPNTPTPSLTNNPNQPSTLPPPPPSQRLTPGDGRIDE
jgi:hypothetical protein